MMHLYFSNIVEVSPKVLDKYGAFNITLVTDLLLFRKDSGQADTRLAGAAGMTGETEMVYAFYGLTPEEIAIVEGKK